VKYIRRSDLSRDYEGDHDSPLCELAECNLGNAKPRH
jgi:hypothetical protein